MWVSKTHSEFTICVRQLKRFPGEYPRTHRLAKEGYTPSLYLTQACISSKRAQLWPWTLSAVYTCRCSIWSTKTKTQQVHVIYTSFSPLCVYDDHILKNIAHLDPISIISAINIYNDISVYLLSG